MLRRRSRERVLDLTSGPSRLCQALGPPGVTGYMENNPNRHHLFIPMFSKSAGGFVAVVDTDPASGTFNTEVSTVNLGPGTQPHGVAIDTTIDKVYVAQSNGGTNNLYWLQDAAIPPTGVAAMLLDAGGFSDGDIAVIPDANRVYVQ